MIFMGSPHISFQLMQAAISISLPPLTIHLALLYSASQGLCIILTFTTL